MKYLLLTFIAQLVTHSLAWTTTTNFATTTTTTYTRHTRPATTSNGLDKLDCDGVIYEYAGIIIQQPAGVCEEDTGTMYRCGSYGNLAAVQFENKNCSGNAIKTASFSSIAREAGITKYSVTCCSGSYCNYGLVRTWNTTTCEEYNLLGVSFSDEVKLIGGCADMPGVEMSQYSSCTGTHGQLTKKTYMYTDSCAGAAYSTEIINDGDCDDMYGNHIQVFCGVAQDTCSPVNGSGVITIVFVGGGAVGFCLFMIFVCCCWRRRRARIGLGYVGFMAPVIKIGNDANKASVQVVPTATVTTTTVMAENNGSYY